MIKKDLNTDLQRKGVDPDYYFFIQLWHELLDQRTLDTYQYTLFNSYSALVELVAVIDSTLDGLYTSNHNVDSCKEECAIIVKNDSILHNSQPALWNTLVRHLNTKSTNKNELLSLRFQLRYALSHIEHDYWEWAFQETFNAIANNNHDEIIHNTKALISQCMFNKWSARGLYHCDRFFYNHSNEPQLSPTDKWERFKRHLQRQDSDYYVYINVKGQDMSFLNPTPGNSFITVIPVNSGEDIVQRNTTFTDEIRSLFSNEKQYIELCIPSKDVYSASYSAVSQLSERINLLSFFNMIKVWDMKDFNIIVIDPSSQFYRSITGSDLFKTYDYLDVSSNIFQSTSEVVSSPDYVKISERLLGAFRYTNISRASFFHEEKYMTLWIAIESLSRTGMENDIISCVKTIIPAALSTRFLFRIIRNFAEDLNRCGVDLVFSNVQYDMRNQSKTQLVKDLLTVLKDDALWLELLSKCTCSELLKYRAEEVHDIVCNLEKAFQCYNEYYKKTVWQTQRFYRIRNQIAHSATTEIQSLTIYAEYLYDYLSILVTEIVICAKANQLFVIDEVFCKIRDNYTVLSEYLKQKPNQLSQEDKDLLEQTLFSTGIVKFI